MPHPSIREYQSRRVAVDTAEPMALVLDGWRAAGGPPVGFDVMERAAGQGLTGGRIAPMTTTAAASAERLALARKAQVEQGVDALLLGPSADLAYLTGYRPPALERLTMLVLPTHGDARLVVPDLRRRWPTTTWASSTSRWPPGRRPTTRCGWSPHALAAAGAASGRLGVGDQLWSGFLLRLQDALDGASFPPPRP